MTRGLPPACRRWNLTRVKDHDSPDERAGGGYLVDGSIVVRDARRGGITPSTCRPVVHCSARSCRAGGGICPVGVGASCVAHTRGGGDTQVQWRRVVRLAGSPYRGQAEQDLRGVADCHDVGWRHHDYFNDRYPHPQRERPVRASRQPALRMDHGALQRPDPLSARGQGPRGVRRVGARRWVGKAHVSLDRRGERRRCVGRGTWVGRCHAKHPGQLRGRGRGGGGCGRSTYLDATVGQWSCVVVVVVVRGGGGGRGGSKSLDTLPHPNLFTPNFFRARNWR